MFRNAFRLAPGLVVGALLTVLPSFSWSSSGSADGHDQAQSAYNPIFHYFIDGQLIGGRQLVVGDSANWSKPVENLSSRTALGKLKVEPDALRRQGDALKATWSKSKSLSQLALYGPAVDLAVFEDKAALILDVKITRKPRGNVTIAMDCEWPCRGEINATRLLKDMPTDEWLALPLPLSCFKGDTFDLSKVNGVFLISSQDRLQLSIANIRLERLPDGLPACES